MSSIADTATQSLFICHHVQFRHGCHTIQGAKVSLSLYERAYAELLVGDANGLQYRMMLRCTGLFLADLVACWLQMADKAFAAAQQHAQEVRKNANPLQHPLVRDYFGGR